MTSIVSCHSSRAPQAIGPYSQAIQVGDFIFCSGQIPLDPQTGELKAHDIVTQTEQVLENLKNLLEDNTSSLNQVVKTSIFLKDLNHFTTVNEIYGRYFKEPYPARACVQVARLPKDVLIEIEAIALVQK